MANTGLMTDWYLYSVTIIGIIRVIDVYHLFFSKPDPNKDPYHSITLVYSSVEVNVAILTATIPTLRPLVRKWFPGLFAGSSANTGANRYYGSRYGSRSRGMHTLESRHDDSNGMPLKDIRNSRIHQTEITSGSPNTSEEEIIRYPGIMRTTDVNVEYDKDSKHSPF